jgi:hypothetical protein
MAEKAPRRAIPVDRDAALAGIDALGGAVTNRINKQERIAGFEMRFDRAFDMVHFVFADAGSDLGMLEVGFVATGNDHRSAIARANVGERHQYIDLTALEPAVMIPELRALYPVMSAGVQTNGLTGSTEVREVFVDE